MIKKLSFTISILVFLIFSKAGIAQHAVAINLDIPFQYLMQYNYTINEKINIEAGFGLVVPPFNKWVFTVLPIPAENDPKRDFARESADWGYVINLGGNYAIKNNWFAGLFGEYAVLKGSSSVKEVYNSSFKKSVEDVLKDNNVPASLIPTVIGLSNDKAEFESEIIQLGIQAGRSFQLKNPKLKLRTSLALSRTISPNTTLTSFKWKQIIIPPPFPQVNTDLVYTEIEKQMKVILEGETDDVFTEYGYITTLRLGLVYTFQNKK